MSFVVLCPGAPNRSTGSCSGFKASQKTGPWFKSVLKRVYFGSKECIKEPKLECSYFLDQTS